MRSADKLTTAQLRERIAELERRAEKLERERKLRWSELLYQNYLRWRASVESAAS